MILVAMCPLSSARSKCCRGGPRPASPEAWARGPGTLFRALARRRGRAPYDSRRGGRCGNARWEPERRDVGRVDLVAVDGDVARLHVLFAHPERDEEADELEQDECADRREDDHPQGSEGLPLEQMQAAGDRKPGSDLH